MVMILCECVSVVVNIWGVGHLALHQGSKYAEQICVPTWVNQVETHRQDRWTYAREHTLARTPRSAPSWMNNLALRSNAGHRGTWQFLCKCGFVCFCVLSLWTSMINHIVWGFPPFHYLLLFIMSVQLSLMVTATSLTYLCTHKPSNVYFICISKHIFIGEDMMGGKKIVSCLFHA